MKLGEVVVTHEYYNFTEFHQNRMKNIKVVLLICSPFFCSEFQSVSRIVKIVHSAYCYFDYHYDRTDVYLYSRNVLNLVTPIQSKIRCNTK